MSLQDSFGRTIDYLRISVTDRCNFRCVYCLPPEGIPSLPPQDRLTFDEITRVARLFLAMGGKKLKITGGEPLVCEDILSLVRRLASLPGLLDFGLTTNGYYLAELALPLKEAGLKRVNISLDSLIPSRFALLTQSKEFQKVFAGVDAALTVGLKTKINVVVLKGISKEEVVAFGEMASKLPLDVRFIEFMPLCGTGWHPEWMIPIETVRKWLEEKFVLLPLLRGSQVAEMYKIKGGKGHGPKGRVGFIASMTEPFCDRCSRIRLTADGKLRPCLFSNVEIDLKPWLRAGWPDQKIRAVIARAVQQKPEGHEGRGPKGRRPKIHFPVVNPLELPRIRFLGG